MSIKGADPILGPSRGDPAKFLAVFFEPDAKDKQYVASLARWARVAGVDDAIADVQFCQECTDPGAKSPGTSVRWNRDLNPAGIGIQLDTTNQPVVIANGDEAARIHIQCLYSLVKRITHPGVPIPPAWLPWFKSVWLPKVCDVLAPTVTTLADLNIRYVDTTGESRATWAWDANYLNGLLAYAQKWLPDVRDAGKGTDVPTKPKILLVEGHRNTTGGNAEEASLTPLVVHSYRDALRAAGYVVTVLQEIDGDNDPDYTNGDLDVVGQKCLAWALANPGNLLMLDCHYEGESEGIRGCFAIVPDETGLNGNAPNSNPGNDTWANNPLDVSVARAVATHLAATTGLQLRTAGVTEPGVMSERQTGVGYEGYRLAMFGWTAPERDRMVRLVVEHGNHTDSHDHSIIFQNDFTEKCAAGLVAALNEVYAVTPAPNPKPSTKYGKPAAVKPSQIFTTFAKVTPRVTAGPKSKPSGPQLPIGSKVEIVGPPLFSETTKSFWFVGKDHSRYPIEAFIKTA